LSNPENGFKCSKLEAVPPEPDVIEMIIIQSTFNTQSQTEFLNGDKKYLGSRHKVYRDAGTLVLLQCLETEKIFGIVKLGIFSETGKVYRQHHPLDTDTYSGAMSKYNKYDICISEFKEVNISFQSLARLIGIDNKKRNNITKGHNLNFAKATFKQPNEAEVLEKLEIFVTAFFSST
jgi:hypothetical protein